MIVPRVVFLPNPPCQSKGVAADHRCSEKSTIDGNSRVILHCFAVRVWKIPHSDLPGVPQTTPPVTVKKRQRIGTKPWVPMRCIGKQPALTGLLLSFFP